MALRQLAARFLKRTRLLPQRASSSHEKTTGGLPNPLSSKTRFSHSYNSGVSSWRMDFTDHYLCTILAAQAAIILGINSNPVLAAEPLESTSQNDSDGAGTIGLRKIEDGSVISNDHTRKWRIFTYKGRESFMQGKLDQAESLFLAALQEAKEGFGEKEPHVASACNNLAELYRVRKQFDKAEPLYWQAISILEESFGPEDIRVATALHNLGQFYLMQRKLDEADKCYERAMKIKRRVLGLNHTDYADTLYHLGMVLYLLGKEKDGEALIQESIRILEENGLGESITCIRRLQYLSQIYLKSNRLDEAENVQRKILQIVELSKGWNSMDTVIAAERLALTLQSIGNVREAKELLERCLEARKYLFPEDHIQIAANMLHIARVAMLNSNRLRKMHLAEAIAELDKAKDLLHNSIRISRKVLNKLRVPNKKKPKNGASGEIQREGRTALVILLQSLDALGLVENTKQSLMDSQGEHLPNAEAENALSQCISAYKEFEDDKSISDSPKVKVEYLSCLKHLLSLMIDSDSHNKATLKELDKEIKRVETELSQRPKQVS